MSNKTSQIQNKTKVTNQEVTNNLPTPIAPKVPQHIICKELAEKGYKAKQVSDITGISYNNVAWYFSKYGLTKIANEKLMELYPQVTNKVEVVEKPIEPKVKKVETKPIEPKVKKVETKKVETKKVETKKK